MSDWSDSAVARLEKLREEQRKKDEKVYEQRIIKKKYGMGLWREVRQLTIENCRAFNAKADNKMLTFDIAEDHELSIRSNVDGDKRHLYASFDDGLSRMSWECSTKSGQWDVAATDAGGVHFEWGNTVTTPATIAEQMLDALLFG